MPLYSYKGFKAATGSSIKGKIEAENIKIAKSKLKSSLSIIVSEIKEEKTKQNNSQSILQKIGRAIKPSVSQTEISIMTRQFATLQSAHVPIDESLRALIQQVENETLSSVLSAVKDGVSEGKSLGDSMSLHPNCFDKLYVNMVTAGEASGTLDLVLTRLADFLEYQAKVKGDIFAALAYPLIMILASFGIIAYLFVSVVPKLQKVFSSLKVKLPLFTELLIGFSNFVQNNLLIIFLVLAILGFLFQKWRTSQKGKVKFDRVLLKLPIFGGIVMRVNVSRFTKTLSTLLSSGVPILAALEITKNTIANSIIAKVVSDSIVSVQEGESLGLTIEKSGQFPPLVSHMIKTGEKTGEIETMLEHVSKAYDVEVERKIAATISLIEPAMIILMGIIVVIIVIAMLVPMLSVMSQMR